MNKLIEEIRKIEFERINYNQESEDYFETQEGNVPILISAPHGARHLRRGKWKEEDEYTSSIAIKLAETTGAHVIYVKNKTSEDPNYIDRANYKDKIREIIQNDGIKFLLDIHGVNKNRPFKICVGTRYNNNHESSCPTYKDIIEEVLRDFQEPPIFNRRNFKAKKKETVTSFARKECGIESAQVEINARYRIVERKPDSSKAMSGEEPVFKAAEEDVLALFDHLKEMIIKIREKIDDQI
ncbi:MAG: hypothetical protein JSW56_12580 [Deltaproteobacteria bacterium]|nr:MAG: hypothetical protein JSW56_12580 [Deltaproteobacteria bacterium]